MIGFCPGMSGARHGPGGETFGEPGAPSMLIPRQPRRTCLTAYELALELDLSADIIQMLKDAICARIRVHDATGTSCAGSTLERTWQEKWTWTSEKKPTPLDVPDLLEGTVCRRPEGQGYVWPDG